MGGEFHRLVMVALAAGLLVIPGCGAGDGTGQGSTQEHTSVAASSGAQTKIVSAQLEGTTALRVTFSDAVKPVTGVDPGKFRLTVAYYTRPASASSKYSYAYYAKTGSYTKTGGYKGYGYGSAEHTIYSDVARVASLANDTSPDEAVLQLGATFDAATACQEIKAFNAANPNAQAGLYLHYTEAGSPTIEDTSGNPVASLAAFWATDPTIEQINGDFTGKPIPVALTCP
jgi:hypothetical protein